MKRIMLFVLITVALVTFANAQGIGQAQGGTPAPRTPPEAVAVTGNLTIAQGMIALKSGDLTYLTPSLNRYVGFIDGLKDGAQVKLEGFAAPNRAAPNQANKATFFFANKMTIGGKDYDLGRPQMMNMGMQNRQHFSGQHKGKNYAPRHQQGKGKNTPQGRGPRR